MALLLSWSLSETDINVPFILLFDTEELCFMELSRMVDM